MKAALHFLLNFLTIAGLGLLAILVASSTGAAFVAFGPLIGSVVAFFWIAVGVSFERSERL
ncbi:hypothetical protein ELH43_08540 [Rhizobium ruizarguesonis]|uniref:Transmembrane protein n=1 Tax=Rhizobium phage vB_RleA_TRX32-1 TaxID=2777321 RepID=A0A7T7GRV3_9CAUD|nr:MULTISPECIES: hypothetical protein [Rhizobium]QQM14010.1 hypothetical protein [Rhizobium phage vB_RleA_TRX32-1]MBY3320727.1 hypothetical protein [Rhizobium laguerreae]TAY37165.1 hypothetical protein ELH89_08585 [Rhizobium leguminosarum]TBA25982.1 hypothetical protein ELH61_09325 [Rhizobium ruizarguesonis]TBB75431.1 hypothetical protein ELH43_08540 [Rhizobium ruizarguesonis]